MSKPQPFPTLVGPEGDEVVFLHRPGQTVYQLAVTPTGWLVCYSMVRDEKGWFWSWSYKPIGPGSRTGNASSFEVHQPRRFRNRKSARLRSEARALR